MESCLPGCKIHHLAFQNIPLWISLLLMPSFIEMEIMGTPAVRGRQVNVLSPSMLAEMGQLSCWFPQPPTSCSNVELLLHAFYKNRHVCWAFASCHIEGTDVFARNVKEFPSILLNSAPWRFVQLLLSCLHLQIHSGFAFEEFRQSSAPQSSPNWRGDLNISQ